MLYRKGVWFRHLVILGLGAMILSMFCLLPGCGSDSTPKGAASAKKEQPAKSDGAVKAITPLLLDKKEVVGTEPPLQPGNKHPFLLTPEEIEAKRKASIAAMEKRDPKTEILPGLTLEQLDAKLAEERAKKPDPNRQLLPGLTQQQLDAKLAEARSHPTPLVIVPGLTEQQAKAKAAEAKQLQDMRGERPEQMFPPDSGKKSVK